jgi:zinc transporter, ZIP family
VLHALVVATLTGLLTGLGVVPFFFRDTIPRRVYDGVLGVGSGLMLSAATLGLLAEALAEVRLAGALNVPRLLEVLGGFAVGVAILALMERIPHEHAGGHMEHISRAHGSMDSVHPHEHEHHEVVRKGLIISGAMTIHRLPEGFAIGAAFAGGASPNLGWVLAVAVAFQNACEGAVMGAPLRHAGWSRLKCLGIASATGLATPIGALIGFLAASHVAAALPFFLALAAGALIYLISNEIIPETHSHGNEGVATLGLVFGFMLTVTVKALGAD